MDGNDTDLNKIDEFSTLPPWALPETRCTSPAEHDTLHGKQLYLLIKSQHPHQSSNVLNLLLQIHF